ncbi:MAG TPA: ABC transporter permease [bacterium]|nr:ABC transporter permease [bacterium]
MRRALALMRGDLRNVLRDSMLVMVLVAPILLLLIMRFGIPLLNQVLLKRLAFDLSSYYSLIVIIFSMLLPLLFGLIMGFLLLDEQDEHLLRVIAVTPVTRQGYLLVKFAAPATSIFLFSFLFVEGSGLVQTNLLRFLPLAFLVALQAPMVGMFLVTFAENKVEGLALGKGVSVYVIAPLAGYFIHSPWAYLAGISPAFWILEAFLSETALQYLLHVGAGLVVHLICLMVLLRFFTRKVLS